MPNIHYMHVERDGEANVTAFVPGAPEPLTAHSSHPKFDQIMERLRADDPDVAKLFDISAAVADVFEALSDRLSLANGRVYFDGDEIDNACTKQIVRFLDENVEDWVSLVNFLDNLSANPNEHSREQLYEWLDRRDFTITDEGMLIGYKGVRAWTDEDGEVRYESISSGPGIVDGVAYIGHLPNSPGSVVEIARSKVHHDPAVGCSTGLHVGSWAYAKGFAQGAVLKVLVNPRDVVSVPTDCDFAKVRCCRYTVLEAIDAPVSSAYARVADDEEELDYDDDEYCDVCGSPYCSGYGECG